MTDSNINFDEMWESGNAQEESKNAVRVTGALGIPNISPLNLSEFKLIEIYNDVPQVLVNSAIEVTLTAESYRKNTRKEIFVEKLGNGNYWVIAKDQANYWLLPKGNIKINIHKMKTVKSLFIFQGEKPESASEFILIKPAVVSLMPSGREWKLEKQGVLDFGNSSHSSKLQSELELTNEERSRLQSQIEQFHQEHEQFQSQVEQFYQERQQLQSQFKQFRQEISQLQMQLEKLTAQYYKQQTQLHLAAKKEFETQMQPEERRQMWAKIEQLSQERSHLHSQPERNASAKYAELVATYNKNPDLLLGQIITVSQTVDSIQHRLINSLPAVFKRNSKGVYWILTVEELHYLILDKNKIQINEHSLKTTQAMFECRGYQPGESSKFKLVKPARVSPISENNWELVEPGILQFGNT